ncbi:MAG: hypothetical protein N3H32_01995, partial [Nitrososphaeria archaeon]|nr:hypothetical protein [Nitrososphaeria archaeon]
MDVDPLYVVAAIAVILIALSIAGNVAGRRRVDAAVIAVVDAVRSPRAFFMDGEIVCAPVHDKEVFLALLREAEHLVFCQDEPDLQ